ncbi:hypothetical protein K0M31_003974 [Melipona bicolor]|uniref:Ig-like domain-containing protein n=1 Tax=Melipona bicolor TaxID=60889 RepID=A0AA40FYC3_9HYME|nr:hypothetical protein K0M31_003974 [Melipona bicolor]
MRRFFSTRGNATVFSRSAEKSVIYEAITKDISCVAIQVTWVQQPSKDSFRLLTFGRIPYSVDQRISLNFRYPSNWRLQIQYATPRDSGLYKCQVATHPPLVKTINVVVTAPELTITDDSGRVVSKERHLKAGSALKLRCEARDVIESLKESVIWTRGDETLTEDVSENRTTEILAGKEVLVIVSTLIVERASPRHAGNYSCVVPGKAKTTVAVHVLNDYADSLESIERDQMNFLKL